MLQIQHKNECCVIANLCNFSYVLVLFYVILFYKRANGFCYFSFFFVVGVSFVLYVFINLLHTLIFPKKKEKECGIQHTHSRARIKRVCIKLHDFPEKDSSFLYLGIYCGPFLSSKYMKVLKCMSDKKRLCFETQYFIPLECDFEGKFSPFFLKYSSTYKPIFIVHYKIIIFIQISFILPYYMQTKKGGKNEIVYV